MHTSCVGSFPIRFCKESVERVLRDLHELGLTYPCYPQLRDFISMFLDPLVFQGLLEKTGLNYKVLIENFEVLRNVAIPIPSEALWFVECIRKLGFRFSGLRAAVTGPFTLASRIYPTVPLNSMRGSMMANLNFLECLASALSRLIHRFESLGYDLIVIDEPILSVTYGARGSIIGYSDEDILKILSMLQPKKAMMGIHVCGAVSPALFKLLLKSEATLLDHEFKDTPRNFSSLKAKDLKRYDKLLSLGCVSSKKAEVETVEEVSSFLAKATDVYEDRVYMVKPDCGFRGLLGFLPKDEAYIVSLRKIKAIVEAVKKLNLNN